MIHFTDVNVHWSEQKSKIICIFLSVKYSVFVERFFNQFSSLLDPIQQWAVFHEDCAVSYKNHVIRRQNFDSDHSHSDTVFLFSVFLSFVCVQVICFLGNYCETFISNPLNWYMLLTRRQIYIYSFWSVWGFSFFLRFVRKTNFPRNFQTETGHTFLITVSLYPWYSALFQIHLVEQDNGKYPVLFRSNKFYFIIYLSVGQWLICNSFAQLIFNVDIQFVIH